MQIGFQIAKYNSQKIFKLRRPEWFLVEWWNTLTREAFLKVGVGSHFLWLHDRSRPERSCFVPYFKHALEKTKIFDSYCAGEGYFEDGSAENSDILNCSKAVAFPNKNNNDTTKYKE